MTEQELIEYKKQFASEWLKCPNDPFKAALAVFGVDTGSALRAAQEWPKDGFVIAEQARLQAEGFEVYKPEELRNKLITELLKIVENEKAYADDKIKAADQIGKLKALHPKQETNINNNVITANKVMLVRDHGSNEDWEHKLREQQRSLKNGIPTTH